MRRIGIVCASDTELAPFLERTDVARTTERAMLRFYEGTAGPIPVTAVYGGVCKVNAAVAAELLIGAFGVDAVIDAGTAGGLNPGVGRFDTVVAERSFYHDVSEDILTEFHPWMPSVYFPSDGGLLAAARAYAAEAGRPLRFGTIATGEAFIEDGDRERIYRARAPLAVDMETAAVAHVCYVERVPFLSVRTVTDTAGGSGAEAFERNCVQASKIAAEVTMGILRGWAGV